jgi:hypothetical protein
MKIPYIELVDRVHVGSEICRSGHFGESAGEELVVVQVVDDEEEALEAGVGLGEELGVAHQIRDGDIGKLREELLQLGMGLEMPAKDQIII